MIFCRFLFVRGTLLEKSFLYRVVCFAKTNHLHLEPYYTKVHYEIQYEHYDGTKSQAAPPRSDLNPCRITHPRDSRCAGLQCWKSIARDRIIFEGSVLVAIHQFAVDFNVFVNAGNRPRGCAAAGGDIERDRTAAIELDIWSALKSSRVGDGQRGIIRHHCLLSRKAVFIRLAVEGHGKAADLVELLLNIQTAGNNTVASNRHRMSQ